MDSSYGTPPVGGDVNHGVAIEIVLILTTILAVLVLLMRIGVRLLIVHSVGWDDYTILAANVSLPQSWPFSSLTDWTGRWFGHHGIQSGIRQEWWRKTYLLSRSRESDRRCKMERHSPISLYHSDNPHQMFNLLDGHTHHE